MSGAVAAALVGIAGAVTAFGGGNQVVSLGNFVFQGFEVPATIPWGGAQQIKVHKLVGGGRVIDAMGRDDAEIRWSGQFLSADASSRADQLDRLRIAGAQLALVFSGRSYTVVISRFVATQKLVNHVPYTISCTVLQDNTAAVQAAASPSLLSQVTNDLNSALGIDVPATLAAAQTALAAVSPVLTPLTALVGGTAASIAVASGLGTAQAAITSADALAEGQLAGITDAAATAGNVIGASTAAGANAAMLAALSATQTAAAAQAMSAYVGRAVTNVGNAT